MSQSKISTLEPVSIREVWPREATHFTPWLARPGSLELLGETLGLELVLQGTERPVGSFSADILCRRIEGGTDAESWVVIENQYGMTDHDHLGKLLTYVAGLEAHTAVWIAEEFRDEHRAALELLNTSSTREYAYFGIEVKLFSIDQSRPAPQFNVVVQPNDWEKTIREEQEGGLSPKRQLQLDFWREFRDRMDSESDIRCPQPQADSYMRYNTGDSRYWVGAVFSADGILRVDLATYSEQIHIIFERLHESKDEIESQSEQQYEWGPPPRGTKPRVYVQRDVQFEDRERWSEYQQWLKTELERMFEFVVPRVRALAD